MSLLFTRGAQSVTINYVIVDIAPTPQFNVTPFAAYVGLSRSRGRDTIHLLRGFDDKIFPQHPLQDLHVEDERLQWLADDTGKRFETGFYDYGITHFVWRYVFSIDM